MTHIKALQALTCPKAGMLICPKAGAMGRVLLADL
jgi:hypothetical protein